LCDHIGAFRKGEILALFAPLLEDLGLSRETCEVTLESFKIFEPRHGFPTILTEQTPLCIGKRLEAPLGRADIRYCKIMLKRTFLMTAALVLLLAGAGAIEIDSLSLHLHLASLREAQAPEVMEGYLILTAKGPYRTVAAAFESENYVRLHPYERNRQGVFILAMPVPLKCSAPIAYRVIIDGAWIADPLNPNCAEGRAGTTVSLVSVPYLTDERPGLYHVLAEDGRTARFLFKGQPGMVVTVGGTFDNWDPFLYEMAETSPGVYELEVVLTPGIHYYAFYYDGEAHPDPLNQAKATNSSGLVVSVLVVKPQS
jgi:hypothetical protein